MALSTCDAAELLDSESQQDHLHGARLLSAFLKKGEDVRWLLLPSTHRFAVDKQQQQQPR